jgi:hypothetical protein
MMAYSSVLDGRERLRAVPSSIVMVKDRPTMKEDTALRKRRAANRLWLHKEFVRNVFCISHGSIRIDLKII